MDEKETMSTPSGETAVRRAVTSHPRLFENNRYVYPVLSRRSGGISVGINLNPDKICNFDCIYCQVDRTVPPVLRKVDEDRIIRELTALLDDTLSGSLFQAPGLSGYSGPPETDQRYRILRRRRAHNLSPVS